MKPSFGDLHQLIQNMTRSEKRYFKMQAQQHTIGEQNNYVELFDILVAQKKFKEEKIEEKIKKKNWNITPNYLFQKLLDSLHQFHLSTSIKEHIKKQIGIIRLLLNKQLVEQGGKLLFKIEKQIIHYGLYEYMPELLFQKMFYYKCIIEQVKLNEVESIKKQIEITSKQISFLAETHIFNGLVIYWHWQKNFDEYKIRLEKLTQNTILKEKNVSPIVYVYIKQTKAMFAYLKEDFMEALEINQTILKWFETHPQLIELLPESYLVFIGNTLTTAFLANQNQVVDKYINFDLPLKLIPINKQDQAHIYFFGASYSILLYSLLLNGDFEKALKHIPKIEREIKKHKDIIRDLHKYDLMYLIALIYFVFEQYSNTLIWCEKILQKGKNKAIKEHYQATNLLWIITHYELQSPTLSKQLIIAQNRIKQHYKIEGYLFDFLKKSPSQDAYQTFLKKIQPLKMEKTENMPFRYFHYLVWLKSKIKNCSFQDAFDKKDAECR